jgi:hypothetical protein
LPDFPHHFLSSAKERNRSRGIGGNFSLSR